MSLSESEKGKQAVGLHRRITIMGTSIGPTFEGIWDRTHKRGPLRLFR